MRFRLEATEDELRDKGGRLVETLAKSLSGTHPEISDILEKAIPAPPRELKYPVLRDLKAGARAEYEETLKRMLAEIGEVLDGSSDFQKAQGGPFYGPRGGKWADPDHTIPWDSALGAGKASSAPKETPEKAQQPFPQPATVGKVTSQTPPTGKGTPPPPDPSQFGGRKPPTMAPTAPQKGAAPLPSPTPQTSAQTAPRPIQAPQTKEAQQVGATQTSAQKFEAEAISTLRNEFHGKSQSDQAKSYFLDRNTGLLNARGAAAQPHDPKRPMTARFSIEGFKAFNDNFGHEIPDGALRMAANVLAKEMRDGVKRGGDLEGDVTDQGHADKIAEAMGKAIDPKGRIRVIATAVPRATTEAETLQALSTAHRARKDAEVSAGKLGHRLKVPVAFEKEKDPVSKMKELADKMKEAKAGENSDVSPEMTSHFQTLSPEKAFNTIHSEDTGLLTDDGFVKSLEKHPDHHVASADLRGLAAMNEAFGKEGADTILREFSSLVARKGGGELNAAHPHGDEFQAHHKDPEKLRSFFNTLKDATDHLVFITKKGDSYVVQKGLYFVHGVGKTLDEADRIDLARNKAAQGTVPSPVTLSAADAERELAQLRDSGHSIIEVSGGAGQTVGSSPVTPKAGQQIQQTPQNPSSQTQLGKSENDLELFDILKKGDRAFYDYTQPIVEAEEVMYERAKKLAIRRGYEARDFEEGGALYGWSTKEILDLVRNDREGGE